jgi:non-ribosomal peptide synthetase component F
MTMLAAFKTLLFRYSGENDIAVGMPITMRTRAELEEMVGLFVNTVVLRTNVTGRMTFNELLERVREVTLGAYAHREFPFEKLVEELHPTRTPSRMPLVDVFFDLQKPALLARDPEGLMLEVRRIDTQTTLFDIALSHEEYPDRIVASLSYSTDIFDRSTIERFASHYFTILEEIVRNSDCELRNLRLMTASEEHQVTIGWNSVSVHHPAGRCVHELFEEHAVRAPEATALICGSRTMSYGELSRRSNKVANFLRGQGVGPETLVGVCMDRSEDWVVAMLGVLKAGGAHVSMDPTYPADRLSFMLSDAETPILLTTRNHAGKVEGCDARIVRLDDDWAEIETQSEAYPGPTAKPENAAYVVYTSGSTGKPEGSGQHSPWTLQSGVVAANQLCDHPGRQGQPGCANGLRRVALRDLALLYFWRLDRNHR